MFILWHLGIQTLLQGGIIMRQRYHIAKEGSANDLIIREYAVIGKNPDRGPVSGPYEDEFTLLCQENYNGDDIEGSISRGINDLIATLRTDNMFPVGLLAEKIAESVIELYVLSEDRSTELLFDDAELFARN